MRHLGEMMPVGVSGSKHLIERPSRGGLTFGADLLRCMSPLLALSGHALVHYTCGPSPTAAAGRLGARCVVSFIDTSETAR